MVDLRAVISARLPGGARRAAFNCFIALCIFSGAPAVLYAQEQIPVAPDSTPHSVRLVVDWARFDRLAEVARETAASERLTDVARSLKANVPGEAGRLSPLDWYCLGNAWCAYHYPVGKGRPILRDTSAMEGEEIYALLRKGYRLNAEQSARIHARLLSLLGVPSELMPGLVRGHGVDRGAWVLSQVGQTWMRVDLANCLPVPGGEWRPSPANFQSSNDLDGVLAFLKAHLPDGELTARPQGLKQPLSLSEWEAWNKSEARIRESARKPGADLLYASKTGLFTPTPVADNDARDNIIAPPTADALSALEQLRRKPYKATRGEYLAATARKYVGLPYVWGGENPNNGFDCSGLVHYVCRTWGISLPRTAAEQYHIGHAVSFMELEPGDLVFLANTYKPGVSHVGMYIGDGQWVQAAGTGIGVVVGDVPYFDAGTGPGARRLNLAHLPRVAGEPVPEKAPSRTALASRHATQSRAEPMAASSGGIVTVRVCGDTGRIANSGCDTYKLIRIPKSRAKSMGRCYKHRPLPGERW